jgi:hypothetical protein
MGNSEGERVKKVEGRTHVSIADDTPSLRTREQMACSDETFDEFLLQAKRISRELELPRQGIIRTHRCD